MRRTLHGVEQERKYGLGEEVESLSRISPRLALVLHALWYYVKEAGLHIRTHWTRSQLHTPPKSFPGTAS